MAEGIAPGSLQTITLAAPGFWGLNTQDSPLDLDVKFAAEANNAVIDRKGRLAARKGTVDVSTNGASVLGSSAGIEFIHEFEAEDGTLTTVSAGNNLIFTGTTTLADATPGGATITANHWQAATLSNKFYLFQSGHDPLVMPAAGSFDLVSNDGAYTGTVPEGDVVLAAFGRLFVANTTAEKSIIYWSDLLNGVAWSGGSSGSINLRKYWPQGYDTVVALIEHNGFLIIFGKKSILIYSGADSPATMVLHDTVDNIGCVARDTVAKTGTDILFLSASGLRTLGRTIQEKSAPLGDASKNVNDDLKNVYKDETGTIKGHYNIDEGFYLLTFPSTEIVYCFDTRYPLPDGSLRTTTWTLNIPLCMMRTDAGLLYFGMAGGIEHYSGYLDGDANTYGLSWLTHPLSFGVPGNLKFLKDVGVTLEGGAGYNAVLRWAWDYLTYFSTALVQLSSSSIGEYGVAEYNIAEYSTNIVISAESVPGMGSGKIVSLGLTVTIDGVAFAIQQFEIQATIGRVL